MKKSTSSNSTQKKHIASRDITKGKVLRSLLTGFAVPFALLICASLNVYFSNAAELGFGLADFFPLFALISVLAFAGISLVLLLTKKWLHNLIFALCAGLVICAYAQTLVTTLTFQGLPGDGNAPFPSTAQILINLFAWIVVFAIVIWFCVVSKKRGTGRKVVSFLMFLAVIMQSVSLMPAAITYATNTENNKSHVYLSTKNLFQVSSKKNIIVFVLDRFDMLYYNSLEAAHPEALEALEGFTLYEDNISSHPRTFPAITHLVTGEFFDGTKETQKEYLNRAFEDSAFMKDLENNNYNVNLYIPHHSAFNRTTKFGTAVTNAETAENYHIKSPLNFTKKVLMLTSYFWMPDGLKSKTVSSTTFNRSIAFEGEHPEYSMDISSDAWVYAQYRESGLSVQNEKNNYTFLHLRGCHDPLSIDENGIYRVDGNVSLLQQMRGAFGFISEYITELKNLGLYEDATIIITGDHGVLTTDTAEYENSILTALLVKESGESSTPLKKSSAPVSHENFLATLVKSAQIETDTDYGKAYNEVSKDEPSARTHQFIQINGRAKSNTIVTYEITGLAQDFENWKVVSREVAKK